MVPDDFTAFFAAMAGAAAALVGLLFVAISVAPRRLEDEQTRVESQTLAGSALLSFTNVLAVSTIALIPGANIDWVATFVGVGGLIYMAGQSRTWLRDRVGASPGKGWFFLVLSTLAVFGWEAVEGIILWVGPGQNRPAIDAIAGLLVGSLTVGIGRSWRLVGMRDTGIAASVSTLLHGQQPGSTPRAPVTDAT